MSPDHRLQRNNSRLLQRLFVYNPARVYFQRKIQAPKVFSGFSLPSGAACIEVGCGHGAGTLLISRHFDCRRIVGVDNDPEVIERARSYVAHPPAWARGTRTDQIEFICADAAQLPYADCSFDAAFLFGVLNSAEEWMKIISEAFRILKPGGVFAFKEAIGPAKLSFPPRLFVFVPCISEQALKGHLARTGFRIERFEVSKGQPKTFVRARKYAGLAGSV